MRVCPHGLAIIFNSGKRTLSDSTVRAPILDSKSLKKLSISTRPKLNPTCFLHLLELLYSWYELYQVRSLERLIFSLVPYLKAPTSHLLATHIHWVRGIYSPRKSLLNCHAQYCLFMLEQTSISNIAPTSIHHARFFTTRRFHCELSITLGHLTGRTRFMCAMIS
jgi:hypothetical protein